jgi:hypothetical protein
MSKKNNKASFINRFIIYNPKIHWRSSGGVESRRNEVTERWSGGAEAAEEWNRGGTK